MFKIEINANELKSFCKTFSCDRGTRYYLEGVFFTTHKGNLLAVATNGAVLGVMQIEGDHTSFSELYPNGVIVPRDTILDLKTRPSAKITATLEFLDQDIAFKSPNGAGIIGRAVEASFPDWTRVIPETVNQEPARYTAGDLLDLGKFAKAISAKSFQIGFNGEGPAWIEFRERSDCFAVVMPYKNKSVFSRPNFI